MIKAVPAPWSRSLGGRFLRLALAGGAAAAAAASWVTYQAAVGETERRLDERARLIAGMVNHAAMVSTTTSALRHVLQEVIGAEPEVQSIVVTVNGPSEPPHILAAIDRAAADGAIGRTPGAQLQADIGRAIERGAFGRHHGADWQRVVFIAPLAPHVSQQIVPHRPDAEGSSHRIGGEPGRLLTSKAYRGAILLTLDRGRFAQVLPTLVWRPLIALAAAIAVTVLIAYVWVRRRVLAPLRACRAVLGRRRPGDRGGGAPPPAGDEIAEITHGVRRSLDLLGQQRARLAASAADQAAACRRVETVNERLHREITARLRCEEALFEAQRQAELANRVKSEFLANMSHELRTPLNAITGFSEVMRNELLGPIGNPKYREYVQDIHASGRRLVDIIDDVFDLAQAESATLELDEEDFDVARVVGAARMSAWEHARKGGIELELEIDDGLPMLRADKAKLGRILAYLLSNAIKFTPAGGKVTLQCRCRWRGGHEFRISDTGIGMDPADIATALAPFRQIDSQINRRFEGTGLGLTLTKALVDLHGGSLDLESEPGVGTLVTVGMPPERVVRSPAGGAAAANVVAIDGRACQSLAS